MWDLFFICIAFVTLLLYSWSRVTDVQKVWLITMYRQDSDARKLLDSLFARSTVRRWRYAAVWWQIDVLLNKKRKLDVAETASRVLVEFQTRCE